MRSKQPTQPGRNSSNSTLSFFRNVLVGMVFFEPMRKEEVAEQIERSEKLHSDAIRSHEKSQSAIEASASLLSEFSQKY